MPSGVFTLKQVELAIGQGAWTNQPPISVNYLVVAGGGGGGRNWGGGGGAGGLLQGSIGITAGTSYTVTVGAGGSGGSNDITNNATSGSNSVFGSITATGGGFGGMYNFQNAASGGSGGGGGSGANAGNLGQGTANQGNPGGAGDNGGANSCAGGGGGAGTRGLAATTSTAGNGGAGVASDISGSRVTYAGGGGGTSNSGGTAGIGGVGGGGNGGKYGTSAPTSAGGNTGGGGGGAQYLEYSGGNGGSGIVIVSYPGTTQWFTGGVVNYYNGNVIHIFYQSGTLAPTTPTPILPTYQISRSLRFNSADSAYLNRTPASATNRKTYTFSGWVKVAGNPGNFLNVFLAQSGGTYAYLSFNNSNNLTFASTGDGSSLVTTAVYRDYSAWYHIVLAVDTTQATASNRIKLYVNGSQITSFSTETYPSQNADTQFNTTLPHFIGSNATPGNFFIGYATEINFIDGQALTPSSFGETNAQTGVWQPKAYSGSYGTNGFYLNFSDNSNTTAATLGKDYSGNGNNWTPNNFSVAAGAGNDSLVDTPTPYGTADTGVGGEVRGNYATLNPLFNATTLSNGNLDASLTSASITGTFGPSSGKWYFECTANTVSATEYLGIADQTLVKSDGSFSYSQVYVYLSTGFKGGNGSSASYGASWTSGDVIGVAYDLDVGSITFYKNGVSQGAAFTSGFTAGNFWRPFLYGGAGTNTFTFNFGQRPFAYTAPAGYRALTTWNLPTPPVGSTTATQAGKFFNPVLWTANGGVQTITGVGFSPEFLWIKDRQNANAHTLHNIVVGSTRYLESNSTSAETLNANYVTSIDSDGWSIGSANYSAGRQLVSWCWKANGAGSSNTAGSITSTVSANTTSGFSIATFTIQSSGSATVGHGLGVAPSLILVKTRNIAFQWDVYHASLGKDAYLVLNSTDAQVTGATTVWNSTAPTSTVFSLGSAWPSVAPGNTAVAYCFAAVPGFSAFGSYVGNGSSDGPFVFCGFRPAYLLIKSSTSPGSAWGIYDVARSTFNVVGNVLQAQASDAEITGISGMDILSNGFKLRDTNSSRNASGETYIYAAFASTPFKYSIAR